MALEHLKMLTPATLAAMRKIEASHRRISLEMLEKVKKHYHKQAEELKNQECKGK